MKSKVLELMKLGEAVARVLSSTFTFLYHLYFVTFTTFTFTTFAGKGSKGKGFAFTFAKGVAKVNFAFAKAW